jgi:hypothetical protein
MGARVAALVVALALATGCAPTVEDPRGMDPEDAEALERAAHTADADPEPDTAVAADGEGEAAGGPPTERFELLRPAEEAAEHPLSDLWGPGTFGILDGGEIVFEWANRDALWNAIVVPAGEACREAGPPIEEPLFDEPEPLEAAVDPYWNNRSTSGRGTLVSVMCAYRDPERGPVERYEAHLVATDTETGKGRVVASGGPWEFAVAEYEHVAHLVRDRDRRMADWARQQERVAADPIRPASDYGLDAADPPETDAEQR